MKDSIKVGQTFDVVKIITHGGYHDLFKIGGFTIGKKHPVLGGIQTLRNGKNINQQQYLYMSPFDGEVKRIGKLTITKVK